MGLLPQDGQGCEKHTAWSSGVALIILLDGVKCTELGRKKIRAGAVGAGMSICIGLRWHWSEKGEVGGCWAGMVPGLHRRHWVWQGGRE